MTLISFLLLIILFLVFFIYFANLNPQEITIYFFPDQQITQSVAIVVVACVLLGLILGYMVHLYSTVSHMLRHWKREKGERQARETAAIYRDGVGRLLAGDLQKAQQLLQQALDRDPQRPDTHIALACVLLQEGRAKEALELVIKARYLSPKSLEVLFKLATTYQELGRDEEAVQSYQDILSMEQTNYKALCALRDLHMRHNRWPEALELQARVLKAAPSQTVEAERQMQIFLRYEVARLALLAGESARAAGELQEILTASPDFVPALVSLGDAYLAAQRHEEALQVWEEGYRRLGRGVFLSRIEDFYMVAENAAALLDFFRNSLMERGEDLMLRLVYGKLCLRLDLVDEALEQLQIVESSGAEFPQLHQLVAEAHRRRDRTDEAISQYRKAIGSGRLSLGYLCEKCGESSEEWASRCPACGTWGSHGLVGRALLRGSIDFATQQAIPHMQRQL